MTVSTVYMLLLVSMSVYICMYIRGNAISQPVFRYGFWGTVFCVINFTCFRSNAWTTSLYDLFRKD